MLGHIYFGLVYLGGRYESKVENSLFLYIYFSCPVLVFFLNSLTCFNLFFFLSLLNSKVEWFCNVILPFWTTLNLGNQLKCFWISVVLLLNWDIASASQNYLLPSPSPFPSPEYINDVFYLLAPPGKGSIF